MFIKSLTIISIKSDRFTVRAILHAAKKRLHSVHYTGVLLDSLFHFVTFLQDFLVLVIHFVKPFFLFLLIDIQKQFVLL